MKPRLSWKLTPVALLAALLLSACPQSPPVAGPIDYQAACPDWRWIGIKSGSVCPAPMQPLFGTGPIPPGLEDFCLYEPAGNGDRSTVPALVGRGELVRAARDCMAVGPTAGERLADELWRDLEKRFLVEAGQRSPGAPEQLPVNDAPPGVRLAFLDTHPTGEGAIEASENSKHGYTMAHLARHLACDPDSGCDARITTQLALPYVSFVQAGFEKSERDEEEGGYFGSIGDLAIAVWREVDAWQEEAEDERLVLNLSLGWNGELFGDLWAGRTRSTSIPSVEVCRDLGQYRDLEHFLPLLKDGDTESPPSSTATLAVFCALQDAACRGALVVAAAGNRNGGPDPDGLNQGPLLPAAWEAHDAPDADTCKGLLGQKPSELEPEGPLVYAVGGVQSNDRPLANARPGAEPPRVAYGDHAVVDDGSGRPTAIYTGTSVATAVVSATAAVVWHHNPELSRHQLMERLYENGVSLQRPPADPGLAPDVHRISLCRALDPDCRGPAGAGENPLAERLDAFQPDPMLELDAGRLAARLDRPDFCGAAAADEIRTLDDAIQGNPCPFAQFHDVTAQPWTRPAPEEAPCASCGIFSKSPCKLVVDLPDWRGELHDATLVIDRQLYALHDLLGEGRGPLDQGQSLRVKNIPGCDDETLEAAESVSLSFRIKYAGQDMSVESPLLVVP